MSGTDHAEPTESSGPHFELERTDDYSRYLLHAQAEILSVLRSLIEGKALLTVHFDGGRYFLLTSVLSLSRDGKTFVIDVGGDQEMNAKAVRADKLTFTAVVDKVKIQFRTNSLQAAQHNGLPAFVGVVPEELLRLQRREFFRLSAPIATPARLCAEIVSTEHGREVVDVPLLDISGGGVGFMIAPDRAARLARGDILKDGKILLPNEGLLVASLCIRNMFDVTTRSGAHHVRVGCEFIDLPTSRMTVIQRYITRVERGRKARLSGLS